MISTICTIPNIFVSHSPSLINHVTKTGHQSKTPEKVIHQTRPMITELFHQSDVNCVGHPSPLQLLNNLCLKIKVKVSRLNNRSGQQTAKLVSLTKQLATCVTSRKYAT